MKKQEAKSGSIGWNGSGYAHDNIILEKHVTPFRATKKNKILFNNKSRSLAKKLIKYLESKYINKFVIEKGQVIVHCSCTGISLEDRIRIWQSTFLYAKGSSHRSKLVSCQLDIVV